MENGGWSVVKKIAKRMVKSSQGTFFKSGYFFLVAQGSWLIFLALFGAWEVQASEKETVVKPGTYNWTLEHDELTRSYRVNIPPSYTPTKPPALILAFHGGGGRGLGAEILSGLTPLSDQEGFIVVYPDGVGRTWNDGRGLQRFPSQRDNVDDVAFVSKLIDTLIEKLSIDPKRVYATGISNGGHFVNRLGIELSNKIAAIAPVAATMANAVAESAPEGKPVPVIHFHGRADRFNYWEGGGRASPDTFSVPAIIQWWVKRNGIKPVPLTEVLPDKEDDGTWIIRETYGPGKEGTEVILYRIEGGGHTWPGGYQYYPESRIGKTTRDIHASALMWDFFTKYTRTKP